MRHSLIPAIKINHHKVEEAMKRKSWHTIGRIINEHITMDNSVEVPQSLEINMGMQVFLW